LSQSQFSIVNIHTVQNYAAKHRPSTQKISVNH